MTKESSIWYPFVQLLPTFFVTATFLALLFYLIALRRSVEYERMLGGYILPWIGLIWVIIGVTCLVELLYGIIFGNEVFKDYDHLVRTFQSTELYKFFAGGGKGKWFASIGLSTSALIALFPAILTFIPILKTKKNKARLAKLGLIAAALIVPIIGLCIYFYFRAIAEIEIVRILNISGYLFLWTIVGVIAMIALLFLNINLTGPHRLYKTMLSRTFLDSDHRVDLDYPLKELNPSGYAPFHIINSTANLGTSKDPSIRDRKADFFSFSKCWVGSTLTGYTPTKGLKPKTKSAAKSEDEENLTDLEKTKYKQEWKANNKPIDLGTAMAVSGAAFSSHMGLASIPTVRALLTFINVRLGFWIRRPHAPGLFGIPLLNWQHPGFFCLIREMFGIGMNEKKAWINLSDGGHIENLAIYELLRRRCKFIICVDGEADPDMTFHGLMTITRHAQIDYGIKIDTSLNDIRPNPETKVSRSHYHFSRIHYPATNEEPAATGLLLYIKLSVTGDETELIQRYRKNNPSFPHQSTLDLFYDQEQFEAYRQLGSHAAEGLFAKCLLSHETPKTMEEWFRLLSINLLEPTGV